MAGLDIPDRVDERSDVRSRNPRRDGIAAGPPRAFVDRRSIASAARRAAPFAAPAVLLMLWELAARAGTVSEFMLPAPSAVLARMADDVSSGDLFVNIGLTLYRAFLGFAIGGVAGIGLGLAMARNAAAHWFFDPVVSVGFPMPKIAFLPVFILWFGLYDGSKITIVIVSAIFPVVTATLAGVQSVDKELLWSAKSLGASARRAAWEIAVPAALPQILTGLQVALPTALIVAIVSEMMMGGYGLGGATMEASRMLDSAGVFAGIVETALTGHCVISLMGSIRRRLLVWHSETQEPTLI